MNFLYSLGLWIIFLGYLPKLCYEFFSLKKKRRFLKERIFFKKFSIPKDKEVVWIHAVSVGETKAASVIAKKLKETKKEVFLIISSITHTGQEEAKRSISFADQFVFMPLDFAFIMKKVLKKVRPKLVIIVESDFWYNFLRFSKMLGAKICLVSGKISEKSVERFSKFPLFAKRLFLRNFDLMACQDEEQKRRFLKIGIFDKDQLEVTGNLKFDIAKQFLASDSLENIQNRFLLKDVDFVVTLASTHEKEEVKLLACIKKLIDSGKKLKIFLVPRHPERFKSVKTLLEKGGWKFSQLSQPSEKDSCAEVILVDQMGKLPLCYQLSHVAIVGGSFASGYGGHNILEPLAYQTPVFFGPYMTNQRLFESIVSHFEAGIQVSIKDLKEELERFFSDATLRKRLEMGGQKVLDQGRGALDETFAKIEGILSH